MKNLKDLINTKSKIKTMEELEEMMTKREVEEFITTNGAFDLLHRGHLYILEKAAEHKRILEAPSFFIVGVNSDESIKRYKSDLRPLNKEQDRAYLIASLEYVDYVVIFNETTPNRFLEIVKPRFHIKSKNGYKGLEFQTVKKYNGEIILIDDLEGYSSSILFERAFNIHYLERMREPE